MPDLIASDGVRLHHAVTGSLSSPRVVLLHGLGSDSAAAEPLAAAVGDRLRLARLDLRGHGESEPLTDAARYGFFDRVAADVVELLDHLGWDRATVVGGSLGAAVTVAVVLAAPQRVGAIGLVAPAIGAGPGLGNAVVVGFLDGVRDHGLVGLLDRLTAAMPDLLPPAELADVRANYARQDDAAMRACCDALGSAVLVDDLARLATIDRPTLVIGRRGDPLHPFEMAETYAQLIPGARLVDDAGPTSLSSRPHALADLLVELAR